MKKSIIEYTHWIEHSGGGGRRREGTVGAAEGTHPPQVTGRALSNHGILSYCNQSNEKVRAGAVTRRGRLPRERERKRVGSLPGEVERDDQPEQLKALFFSSPLFRFRSLFFGASTASALPLALQVGVSVPVVTQLQAAVEAGRQLCLAGGRRGLGGGAQEYGQV